MQVIEEIEINKNCHEVAHYAMEPNNDPIWISGISKVELLTERPIGIGTQVQRIAHFLGKQIDYILEVIEFRENELMVMKSIKSPFPMKVTYQFNNLGDKTQAQITIEGDSKGFYKIANFLMKPKVSSSLKNDLKNLKEIMESN
ncbi:hypothetical protein QQ008_06700 [Fulvivirgaceae bacterium BMA10]|uniref:SRPBCC family protein n=1 Tax=Splendidivirga corallicola TaxID=3051826 RepID=A0ABT8KK03_9BACT|nr:hypothetical protein [Fulvivirgaceae bacterium BMA10]